MERQADERVELYAERDACGAEFPENGTPFAIDDNPPSEFITEIRKILYVGYRRIFP